MCCAWEDATCPLLRGLSHSVLSNRPGREALLLSQSPEEETEARQLTQPKVTLGPLLPVVDFAGEFGGPGWGCELCDLGKWLTFLEPQFFILESGSKQPLLRRIMRIRDNGKH